jgi:hypothetical protein
VRPVVVVLLLPACRHPPRRLAAVCWLSADAKEGKVADAYTRFTRLKGK